MIRTEPNQDMDAGASRSQNAPHQEKVEGSLGENPLYDTSPLGSHQTHVATFHDETDLSTIKISGANTAQKTGATDSADLTKFLQRPVKIDTFEWTIATPFQRRIEPFELFLSTPSVAKKLANFRNIYGKLHVKILINGNSFYYGRLLITYSPLTDALVTTDRANLMKASQRMHAVLNPTESEPASMELPFFWPNHTFNLIEPSQTLPGQGSKADSTVIGQLEFRTLNQLYHANGSTEPVTVTTMAWMEEATLGAPTSEPSIIHPALDERNGNVYKIASKTATVANLFTKVPAIAPFASAIEKSSTAIAKVSKVFGWSKPERNYGEFMVPTTTDDMATTDGLDAVKRLVGDTKQGLTIDPRTVGLHGSDELALTNLVTRESYFNTVTWNVDDPVSGVLANQLVDPMAANIDTFDVGFTVVPASLGALTHKYWTGNMKIRISVVASKFHKGRLLIQYDPERGLTTSETNVRYSHIMDISECSDATFDIGWGQNQPFREVAPLTAAVTSPLMSSVPYGNGYLTISVLNKLVSATASTDPVFINIFIAGGDDLRFGGPTGHYVSRMSATEPPSSVVTAAGIVDSHVVKFMDSSPSTNVFHEHFGETTTSFRSLMKRYNHYSTVTTYSTSLIDEDYHLSKQTQPMYPRPIMWAGAAKPDVMYTSTSVPDRTVTTNSTTMVAFLARCFAATRGGMRWAVNAIPVPMSNSSVDRTPATLPNVFILSRNDSEVIFENTSIEMNPKTDSWSHLTYQQVGQPERFMNGSFLSEGTKPFNKVEIPFYSPQKFTNQMRLTSWDESPLDGITVTYAKWDPAAGTDYPGTTLVYYVAAAEDFTCLWFQDVPTFWLVDPTTYSYVV